MKPEQAERIAERLARGEQSAHDEVSTLGAADVAQVNAAFQRQFGKRESAEGAGESAAPRKRRRRK